MLPTKNLWKQIASLNHHLCLHKKKNSQKWCHQFIIEGDLASHHKNRPHRIIRKYSQIHLLPRYWSPSRISEVRLKQMFFGFANLWLQILIENGWKMVGETVGTWNEDLFVQNLDSFYVQIIWIIHTNYNHIPPIFEWSRSMKCEDSLRLVGHESQPKIIRRSLNPDSDVWYTSMTYCDKYWGGPL